MKKELLLILLLILFSQKMATAASPTEDLMKIGAGARPMGMGKAFVAIADDGNAPFLNPAGLADLKTWQFNSMYVSLLEGDLPYTALSGSYPFASGSIGVGLISTGTADILSLTVQGLASFDYYDRVFFLSYGEDASRFFGGKPVHWGGNFKMFAKGFTGSVANTGTGFDIDLGVKYFYNQWLTLGANIQNLLPTSIGWSSGAQDEIPMLVKLGGAAKIVQYNLVLALDMDFPLGRDLPALFHLGVEYPVSKNLTLRAGLDQIASAASRVSTNPTIGLGFDFRGFRLDYAYYSYQETLSELTHFISFSYSPVWLKAEAEAERKPAEKEKVIAEEIKGYLDEGDKLVKEKKYVEAIAEYEKILKITPSHPEAVKKRKEAQTALKKKLVIKVEEKAAAYLERALEYIVTEEYAEAMKELEEVLKIEPENEKALKLYARLKRIMELEEK